jgi:AraC-like DNA-binding protein
MQELPRGIVHPSIAERMFRLNRYPPGEITDAIVQHYWVVVWDLQDMPPFKQGVLAHPTVNLVFERGRTRIYGPAKAKTERLLQGRGRVVGVKFKPGGFYPLFKAPVSSIYGTSIAFEEVFGMDSEPIESALLSQEDEQRAVRLADDFLRRHMIERQAVVDCNVRNVIDLAAQIRDDRSIVKVEDVVNRSGLHKRTLQRLFDRCVGVSPKGVIQRYRLHEAAERMSRGDAADLTDLSLELGYYDLPHFIRDFKAILGMTPQEFAAEERSG